MNLRQVLRRARNSIVASEPTQEFTQYWRHTVSGHNPDIPTDGRVNTRWDHYGLVNDNVEMARIIVPTDTGEHSYHISHDSSTREFHITDEGEHSNSL